MAEPKLKLIEKNIPERNSKSQFTYESGFLPGMGNIANLCSIVDGSIENQDKINIYPGMLYGSGSLEIMSLGIRSNGINGETDEHDFRAYILDDSVIDISDCIDDSLNSHGYTYVGGSGNNAAAYNCFSTKHTSFAKLFQRTYPDEDASGWDNPGGIGSDWDGGGIDDAFTNWDPEQPDAWSQLNEQDNWTLEGFPFVVDDEIGLNVNIPTWGDVINSTLDPDAEHQWIDGNIYVLVWLKAHDSDNVDETRDITTTLYKLPKSLFIDLWAVSSAVESNDQNSRTFCWTSSTPDDDCDHSFPRPSWVESHDGDLGNPAFTGGHMKLKITGPSEVDVDPGNLSSGDNPLKNWYNIQEDIDYRNFFPSGIIDYVGTKAPGAEFDGEIFDFRPISNVVVDKVGSICKEPGTFYDQIFNNENECNTIGCGEITPGESYCQEYEYDLQSFHEYGGDTYENTTAPNRVSLSFNISRNIASGRANDFFYGYNPEDGWFDENGVNIAPSYINIKFFVLDWDDTSEDVDDDKDYWDNMIMDFPQTYSQLIKNRNLYDSFYYNDVIDFESELVSNFHSPKSISHEYQTEGVKIIKVVFFSYMKHSNSNYNQGDNIFMQSLRWKVSTVKIFLGVNPASVQDFSDIGGIDFDYIPWPYTSPIVGGISNESDYIKSIDDIINKNKFNDNELYELYSVSLAKENSSGGKIDELGDHLGKIDLSQTRYFQNGIYDMNVLLNLLPEDVIPTEASPPNSEFYPYNDFYYWNGDEDQPTYTDNSCVGLIFINDSSMKNLRDDCIMEFNFFDEENGMTFDTSGNAHRGISIGDYSIKKPDFGVPASRDKSLKIPEKDESGGSF